jgi:DNA-binding NarL/FixJ family response regulator
MDVRMPGMDGLEATRRIRMLPDRRGRIPILPLTAYTSVEQIEQCREAGMNGHVPKPIDYETLIRAVDDAIAQGPFRRVGGGIAADASNPPSRRVRETGLTASMVLPAADADVGALN